MGSVSERPSRIPQAFRFFQSFPSAVKNGSLGVVRSMPSSIMAASSAVKLGCPSRGRYCVHQNASQTTPRTPDTAKVVRQPSASDRKGMHTAATAAPMLDPLSKIATAMPRSRAGNHSATTLLAPGQFNPSPMPKRNRKKLNDATELAKPVKMLAMDHQTTARLRPQRTPMKSSSTPPSSHVPAYAI